MATKPEPLSDHAAREKVRFEMELEFVQCLANPRYLNHLAQNLYFEDEAFLAYLKYLQYFKQPEYSRFLVYTTCLKMLDLLQSESFRKKLKYTHITEEIHKQQFYHWQYHRHDEKALK